jgi:dCMP deaminase
MNRNSIEGILRLAVDISRMSKDPKRRVGALIVTQDGSPVSWGYNGFSRGIKDDLRLQDDALKLTMVVHAEANAVFNAARAGASTKGGIMVCTLFPCVNCANAIIQSGIVELICPDTKLLEPQSKWAAAMDQSKALLEEAGIKLTLLR